MDAGEQAPYVADAPRDSAFLTRGRSLISLTVDTQVHNVVPANGTIVDHDIPRPQRHSIPLRSSYDVTLLNGRYTLSRTFLTSNLFLPSASPVPPPLVFFTFAGPVASGMSTSAILYPCLAFPQPE